MTRTKSKSVIFLTFDALVPPGTRGPKRAAGVIFLNDAPLDVPFHKHSSVAPPLAHLAGPRRVDPAGAALGPVALLIPYVYSMSSETSCKYLLASLYIKL